MTYIVYFQWNSRGRAAVETIFHCVVPEGWTPSHLLLNGFWIKDDSEELNPWGNPSGPSNGPMLKLERCGFLLGALPRYSGH